MSEGASRRLRQRVAVVGLGVYGLAALAVLLLPVSWGGVVLALGDFVRYELGWAGFGYGWVEFVANVALFLPLGFVLTLAFRRWWWGVGLALLLSTAAELVQAFIPGRVASGRDVLANVIGAAVGAVAAGLVAWTAASVRRRFRQTDVQAVSN